MLENNNISRKKRRSLQIEIPNKEITFCDTKKFSKYKMNNIINQNHLKKANIKNNLEDDYDSCVYNEQICKDKIFFGNKYFEKKHSIIKSSSEIFNFNKKLFAKSRLVSDFFEKNIKVNSMLNLSYDNKNQSIILDYEKSLTKDKSENYKNLKKIINLFSFVNKKRQNKIQKNQNENNFQNSFTNITKNNLTKNTSKFSRKKENKNISITENITKIHPLHNRYITELYIDLKKGIQKNKIIKLNKYNNISDLIKKVDRNDGNPRKINFKKNDDYVVSSEYSNIFENERKNITKGSYLNKSMRKINLNLNDSGFDKNNRFNRSKIKNHSINYSNPKKIKNEKRVKTIINDYMNMEKGGNSNIISKGKKKEIIGKQKIIKKRVILEEEYIINSEGDQKLLSVRRLEDENNNEKDNISQSINKNFIKEKINNENPMNKKYKLNNSFFSSIFKDNSRMTVSNNRIGINSIDDDNQINYIFNNNKFPKTNIKKPKYINTNPPLIKKQNNKIKKGGTKLPIKTDLNGKQKQTKEQKSNKESNNKEHNINKKLFYNRIYINKFNKSNNNSKMNLHPHHVKSDRISINNIENKDKSKLENSKSIYDKISFSKKQPFMIYHNEEKSQNFYINNNQNCSNMVNIVFLNNEKNKNYKEKERPKPICGLKRNEFKFHEIKSISIDNNNSGIKSTRNLYNKNIMNVSSSDDPNLGIQKNNYSIYSSMENTKDKRTKNLEILEYISSKPKIRIDNVKNQYIKKSGFNKSGGSKFFFDYID